MRDAGAGARFERFAALIAIMALEIGKPHNSKGNVRNGSEAEVAPVPGRASAFGIEIRSPLRLQGGKADIRRLPGRAMGMANQLLFVVNGKITRVPLLSRPAT